jgi:hypothetical protein
MAKRKTQAQYLRATDNVVSRNAKALEGQVNAWLLKYARALSRKAIAQRAAGQRIKLTGPDDARLRAELEQIIARATLNQVNRSGKRTAKNLDGDWALDPKVAAEVARNARKRADGIMRHTRATARAVIRDAKSAAEIKRKLHGKKPGDRAFGFGPTRARLISRVEAGKAEEIGLFEGMKASGVAQLEWLAVRDGRSGDRHHERMHGKRVKVGGEFVTPLGNRMRYPKDPRAPVKEVANCRCTIRPIRRAKK